MNKVLIEIVKEKETSIKFFTWFKDKYGVDKLTWFINTEFIEQIGYFIEYFEKKYNYHISCAENGYCVFYAHPLLAQSELTARFKNNLDEFIFKEYYSSTKCITNIIDVYEKVIIVLFSNIDLPF